MTSWLWYSVSHKEAVIIEEALEFGSRVGWGKRLKGGLYFLKENV